MTHFTIKPSYKFDLASFCNLFTLSDSIIKLHSNTYERFKHIIMNKPNYIALAKQLYNSGLNPAMLLVSFFDFIEEDSNDIDKICSVFNNDETLEQIRYYYVFESELISEDMFNNLSHVIPILNELVKYVHNSGFNKYWHDECFNEINKKCKSYLQQVKEYNIIEAVNSMLGEKYALTNKSVTLYLCKFAAPYGTSLRNQALISDISWGIDDTLATVLHELLHPPYLRSNIIKLTNILVKNEFFMNAYQSQINYNTPLKFTEENIVEAAHVYLAKKMGLIAKPYEYLKQHDNGSHVISVIIYEQLQKGIRDTTNSLEHAIENMIDKGVFTPGMLKDKYNQVYQFSY